MSNLKEIRSRIVSVSSTMKITSAMKMVSAAKLKRSQERMSNIKPYSEALSSMIQNLIGSMNKSELDLMNSFSETEKILLVPISSNRGLCGGFNSNVYKSCTQFGDSDQEVWTIGKKITDIFNRSQNNIIETEIQVLNTLDYKNSKAISTRIIDGFKNGRWSKVYLIYNQFKNTATQIMCVKQLLPLKLENKESSTERQDYIFEPDKSNIINMLIPQHIHTQLFDALLNSVASEHGARMTAMHKATDNANELKQQLTLSYNRQRQAAITNEILEIVAGAEALKGT